MSRYQRLRRCYGDILALPPCADDVEDIEVMRIWLHLRTWKSPWRRLRHPVWYWCNSSRIWELAYGILRERRARAGKPRRVGLHVPTLAVQIARGEEKMREYHRRLTEAGIEVCGDAILLDGEAQAAKVEKIWKEVMG